MNVKEVMCREVRTVRMVDRLDAAARVMWEHDCGIVPVVDGNQAVVGVVTDRDVCMAGYTQGRPLGDITVTAVMARGVRTCRPDEPLHAALATMQQHQLHRLPVVDARGVVVGMLAMNDLIRLAQSRPAAVEAAQVLKALATIVAPRRAPAAAAAPAATAGATAAAGNARAAGAGTAANAHAAIPAVPSSTAPPNAGSGAGGARGDKGDRTDKNDKNDKSDKGRPGGNGGKPKGKRG
jgi:CBS domain-containing protein